MGEVPALALGFCLGFLLVNERGGCQFAGGDTGVTDERSLHPMFGAPTLCARDLKEGGASC